MPVADGGWRHLWLHPSGRVSPPARKRARRAAYRFQPDARLRDAQSACGGPFFRTDLDGEVPSQAGPSTNGADRRSVTAAAADAHAPARKPPGHDKIRPGGFMIKRILLTAGLLLAGRTAAAQVCVT